jgi:hypothetical protein
MGEGVLTELLKEAGLADAAEKVGESMYRIEWGSATLVTGVVGDGIVVIAPMFEAPPASNTEAFFRRLLQINGEMGGTATIALQADGSVVLQVGRGVKGLDAHEFGMMLGTVGRFADQYDNRLHDEFYKE